MRKIIFLWYRLEKAQCLFREAEALAELSSSLIGK